MLLFNSPPSFLSPATAHPAQLRAQVEFRERAREPAGDGAGELEQRRRRGRLGTESGRELSLPLLLLLRRVVVVVVVVIRKCCRPEGRGRCSRKNRPRAFLLCVPLRTHSCPPLAAMEQKKEKKMRLFLSFLFLKPFFFFFLLFLSPFFFHSECATRFFFHSRFSRLFSTFVFFPSFFFPKKKRIFRFFY